jgi:hypothetical protein
MSKIMTKDISRRVLSLIKDIGPEINGSVPLQIYDMLRRYGPMYCVDGVPVLSQDEPSVILLKRNTNSVAPHSYWIIGGRVDKKTFEETDILKQKCASELGLDIKVSPIDIIGRGRLSFTPNATKQHNLSGKDYTIVTPTQIYAIRLPRFDSIVQKFSPSDGNVDFHKLYGREIALAENLHPYIQNSCLVAMDKVYGIEWRKELPMHLRSKGYIEKPEQWNTAAFIPLNFNGI